MLRNTLLWVAYTVGALAAPNAALPLRSRGEVDAMEGYAFLYFTSADEQIYLAASNGNDALSFTELNGGRPILTSTEGDFGLRDPFIIRSQDGSKFFIIATDLCVLCGTTWEEAVTRGSQYLEIWESEDLITFSAQRHVRVSPDTYGNTWAPEAYWDAELETYVVHWAAGIFDESDQCREEPEYQRMVYATTDDFITFSEPKVWQDDPPAGRIDSTVISADGLYYRFTKATVDGCADIVQESSPSLTAPLSDWTLISSCIGNNAGTSEAVEGPAIFKTNPGDVGGERYILIVDEFGAGSGYVPLESNDLASGVWTLNSQYDYPVTPRHGTIVSLTAAELDAIKKAWA